MLTFKNGNYVDVKDKKRRTDLLAKIISPSPGTWQCEPSRRFVVAGFKSH